MLSAERDKLRSPWSIIEVVGELRRLGQVCVPEGGDVKKEKKTVNDYSVVLIAPRITVIFCWLRGRIP